MTNVQKICRVCGYRAKRALLDGPTSVGCRGTHETASELALCPRGHGALEREDGRIERDGILVGKQKP